MSTMGLLAGMLLTGAEAFQRLPHPRGFGSPRRGGSGTARFAEASGLVLGPSSSSVPVAPAPCSSLGMPRVHRYRREEGAEWVMWFQGRDSEIEDDVIQLSTGRIYRARSDDGVQWSMEPGAGALGASLDRNADEWWGFDTAHVGVGDIRLSNTDKVLTDGGIYLMYYFGGNFERRPLSDLATSGQKSDAEVVGMNLRIGMAVSQDGLHWSRLEGEHANNAVLDVGKEGDFDELLVGWPQVVNFNDKEFRMYYQSSGGASSDDRFTIGWAKSQDGFKWDKMGKVNFERAPGSKFDEKGISRRHVIQLESNEDAFTMVYEGIDANGRHSIGIATSTNGVDWKSLSAEPVFAPSDDADAWDAKAVGSPHVVELPGGELRLFYVGTAMDGTCAIGSATGNVADLTAWERCSSP